MPNTAAEIGAAPLDIAVGVLVDAEGRLLVALRRPGTPGAGCWEFPGGKREPGEPMFDCLARELEEEIGIRDINGRPLIMFAHDRGVRPVRLHVWRIDGWTGQPSGREGQRLRWAHRGALDALTLLPATEIILRALDLPSRYLITPAISDAGPDRWWRALDQALAAGHTLLRLRDHGLDDDAYAGIARSAVARSHAAGARLLVDRDVALCDDVGADGLHWPIARLRGEGRPALAGAGLLAVSVHDAATLAEAAALQADFATLSPVVATATHPKKRPLGWSGWVEARSDQPLSVYALGGLSAADIDTARAHNAQGVAAIRGFWPAAQQTG